MTDFADIFDGNARLLVNLEEQQVGERRLRTLDHRRQHGLLAHEGVEEQRRVRQQVGQRVELAKREQRGVEPGAERRRLN